MFTSLWRYKWHIVVAALLAAAVAYGLSTLRETLYHAEGTVILKDPRSSGGIASELGLDLDPRRYVSNQAKVMESPTVAQRAADNLGEDMNATDVQNATSAAPTSDLDAVTVTGSAPSGPAAAALVDALVVAYEEIITEQIATTADTSITELTVSKTAIEHRITALDELIAQNPNDSTLLAQRTSAIDQLVTLDTRIALLATNVALYGSGIQLYVAPDVPANPIQPQPVRNAAIAFAVGAIVAGAGAWWYAEQNQTAVDRDDPARVLRAPILATVPDFRLVNVSGPAPTITDPGSGADEAYQFAMSSLRFALERVKGRSILVTSTSPGDGKTATALNLAIAAVHDGRSALLIDADERSRGLTRISDLEMKTGISDLDGPESIGSSIHPWLLPDGTTVDVMPAGTGVPGNTASFFRSDGFHSAAGVLFDGHDLVIIDSPPVMAAAETTDIAAVADGIVVVVAQGARLSDLEAARNRLEMSGTPIIGYIFNRATSAADTYGYGHSYGYGQSR